MPGTLEGGGERMRHSVTLDSDRCIGCTNCIKKCPTEAIRVRKGRAKIIEARCIDCGECIRTCPQGAKKAVSDPLSMIRDFSFTVALPAPSLYAQFDEKFSRGDILEALLGLGFDDAFEVALAAEEVSAQTQALLSQGGARPLISAACPSVVRLIQLRFPSLIPNLATILPPMEVAARIVRDKLYPGREGLGVFFISPCAGKVSAVRTPLGYRRSAVDGVIGIKDVYLQLRKNLEKAGRREAERDRRAELPGAAGVGQLFSAALERGSTARAGGVGIGWARAEGETRALGDRRAISVDGIGNVIEVLEELENGKIRDIDYIEALACPAGCVGGPMTVGNPFVSRSKTYLRECEADAETELRARASECGADGGRGDLFFLKPGEYRWSRALESQPTLSLDADMRRALVMAEEMERIASGLPGLDCGACGSPSCKALAEDIVRGEALITDCIFKLRENVRKLAGELIALEAIQPPGLDREKRAE